MNIKSLVLALVAMVCFTGVSFAADATVTLSDVHMCCGNCVKGVDTVMTTVPGAKAVASQEKSNVVITAPDKETLQKAVNALVLAGYFGKSSDSSITAEDVTNAPIGKVQTMTVSGVHLCCAKCVTAVKGVLSKIDGVKGNTVAPKATSFMVTGDFDAKTVFAELNKAGLAGKAGAPNEAVNMPNMPNMQH